MQSPEWAVRRARVALDMGIEIPEVERQLIAKGLTPEEANKVVMSIIEGRAHATNASQQAGEGLWWVQLLVSVIVAAVFLGLAYWFGGTLSMAWTMIWVLPGLAGVWLAVFLEWGWGFILGWIWLLFFGGCRVFLVVIYSLAL